MGSSIKDEALEAKLNTILKKAIDELYTSGANLLVMKDGQEIAYCEAGFADIEQKRPIQRNTIFRIYSMTKPITGLAIMILMERGLIDLAEPVSMYLPGFTNQKVATDQGIVPVKRDMMIKDLLAMTSGMPYPNNFNQSGMETAEVFQKLGENLYSDNAMTTQEVANELGKCSLSFQPGEHWMYGTSADILGAVVEVITGMKYGEFLKKEIFDPLEMKDTDFYVPEEKQERFTKLYDKVDGNFVEARIDFLGIPHQRKMKPSFESGGAGLASTIDDYGKFATMLLNGGELNGNRIISPKTVEFFTRGELMPWQQVDLWNNIETLAGYSYANLMRIMKKPDIAYINGEVDEYGWDGWLGTYFSNFPNANITFLIMMQKRDAGTVSLTRKLRNVIMAELFQ